MQHTTGTPLMWAFTGLLATAVPVQAHFLWLAQDPGATPQPARLFFGEHAGDRDYHFPERLQGLAVIHRDADAVKAVAMDQRAEDGFVGLISREPLPPRGVLEATATYGTYHGSLLTYYAMHYLSPDPTQWARTDVGAATEAHAEAPGNSSKAGDSIRLNAVPLWTSAGQLQVRVTWDGQPVAQASVKQTGRVSGSAKATGQVTNADGLAALPDVGAGMVGLLVGHELAASGDFDGKPYTRAAYYTTVTFTIPETTVAVPAAADASGKAPEGGPSAMTTAPWAELPVAVASFGGAVSGDQLYVYGGHIGTAHSHSRDNLSRSFLRLNLMAAGGGWEPLPYESAVQGVALVAYANQLYRVGGMEAKNAADEDEHLISTDEVSRFDIATETWQPWPRMPVGRSSHDAVVLGSRLFVFGGWQLPGAADEGDWHARGLVIDLAAQQPEWREIAQPFQRRAIACATLNGQIVVIGGIDQEGTVSQQVDLYDPRAESWSQADPFPEREGMKGFGVSAWELDGCLYASGAEGVVYCLAAADGSWEVAGKLEQPRFFHRLLPGPGKTLLAVAGASRQGHLSGIEQLGPFAPPVRP